MVSVDSILQRPNNACTRVNKLSPVGEVPANRIGTNLFNGKFLAQNALVRRSDNC